MEGTTALVMPPSEVLCFSPAFRRRFADPEKSRDRLAVKGA